MTEILNGISDKKIEFMRDLIKIALPLSELQEMKALEFIALVKRISKLSPDNLLLLEKEIERYERESKIIPIDKPVPYEIVETAQSTGNK